MCSKPVKATSRHGFTAIFQHYFRKLSIREPLERPSLPATSGARCGLERALGMKGINGTRMGFFVAFAFCIWDGGRLPAEEEWLYTAHGGPMATAFPWGDSPDYGELFAEVPGSAVPNPYEDDPYWPFVSIPVGSHPASVGLFGHHDLIGGLSEFVRDMNQGSPEEFIQLDYDELVYDPLGFPPTLPKERASEGPAWHAVADDPNLQDHWDTGSGAIGFGQGNLGVRCARNVSE